LDDDDDKKKNIEKECLKKRNDWKGGEGVLS
jgi:hypothetical protein